MTGEVQPGGRAPAPEPLEIVQALLNTTIRGEPGADLLDHPGRWAAWLDARGLDGGDPARVRAVREALHDLLVDPGDARALAAVEEAAGAASLRPRFGPARVEGAGLVGAVLAAAWSAMADGTWRRLKACPGRHCGWAFYDRSASASSIWCSMSVCGQREKARAYYRRANRHRSTAGVPSSPA